MANAPRHDGTIDFHVRIIDGGAVSSALARSVGVGSRLRLGAPVGTLRLDMNSRRDVLLAAGSAGLAPLKAIIEQAAGLDDPPRMHLVFGARTATGLYDLADLEKMAAHWPWLTVTPAVSAEPEYRGETGTVADVIGRRVPPGRPGRVRVRLVGDGLGHGEPPEVAWRATKPYLRRRFWLE